MMPMPKTGSTTQAQKMADLTFSLLEHCQEKQERIASGLKLTVAEFKLLRCFRSETMVNVSELARRMGLTNSRLTRILDGLVEKGIARRDSATKDRRVKEIVLTDRGRKAEIELDRIYIQTHQHILDLIPEGARDSVLLAMEKLGEAMTEWSKR
jgi:DNA-binding MarR family transcriptional regulator